MRPDAGRAMRLVTLLGLLLSASACTADSRPRVFIAGDSTASHYETKHTPQSGWGQALAFYLHNDIVINNRASSGRSTKSFQSEGRWQDLVDDLRAGDVVLMSFGHNDARDDSPQRFTEPDGEYRENLMRFARDVLARDAHPVVLSPAARRLWEGPVMVETHGLYALNAKSAARASGASFIDLASDSLAYFEALGAQQTKRDFLWLEPDSARPRFPEGVEDNTHFSELGACGVAQVIATAMLALPATTDLVDSTRFEPPSRPGERPVSVVACAASLSR